MAAVDIDDDGRPIESPIGGDTGGVPPDEERFGGGGGGGGGGDGVFGDTTDSGGPEQNQGTNTGTNSGGDKSGNEEHRGGAEDSGITGTADGPAGGGGGGGGGDGTGNGTPGFAMPEFEFVPWQSGAGTGTGSGRIDPRTGEEYTATTREVQDDELVANQLNSLLQDPDSAYMKQARMRGLAAANARGGLGGTMQAAASMNAAIRAGLPIATADAQAYRDAAAQNMNALNQFGLANMQRATQIAMANLDAATRVKTTAMTNASQQSIAKLQSMTQLQNTALQGEIQSRLAEQQFLMSQVLNAEQHGYTMEQIGLQGEYGLADTDLRGNIQFQIQRETNYTNQALGAMDTYFARLDSLNGMEMDDAARQRARQQYYNDYVSTMNFLNSLYPDVPPISMIPEDG